MTLNEFKAWLEGFEEAIDGAPTEAQWKKLKDKLATLEPDRPAYAPPSYPTLPASPCWPGSEFIVISGGSSTNPRIWNGTTWTAWNKTGVPYSLTQ